MTEENRRRDWLRHWHSVLDAEIGKDSSFSFKAAYDDPYGDFRMHFSTWDLTDEALRRCFEVLPAGLQMVDRAIEMRIRNRKNSPKLSEDAAVEVFQSGLESYSKFSDDSELLKPIRVKRIRSEELNKATMYSDSVAVVLEAIDWRMPAENQEANSFLRETLYRLAHSYDIVDYITWPLISNQRTSDPYRPFALLAAANIYFPLLDEDGPVLFVLKDQHR